jgi:hypothetical protein
MAEVWPTLARKKDKGQRLTYTDTGEPKGCLHTTESSDWPGYRGWKVNPHITAKPIPGKGIEAECNVPLNYASFALRNEPGGVQTGRDNVIQIELIGTCEKGGPGYYWPEADDAVLLALAELIVEVSRLRGIPMKCLPFESYPDSYGKGNGVRLSGAEFDRYSGWLGHQHVAENSHGDPGAFPWARMLRLYAQKHRVSRTDARRPVIKRVLKLTTPRMSGSDVIAVRRLLGQKSVWPFYDVALSKAVAAWQRAKHLDDDGKFGPDCCAKAGFVWAPKK